MHTQSLLSATAVLLFSSMAQAAIVTPTSYDLLNGNSGSFNYWDDRYIGSGNKQQDGAALSGGLGDLTDGVIATQNWNLVEGPRGPHGPYVGWANKNPTVNFHFGSVVNVDSITVYADDSNGYGGVSAPSSITINGTNFSVTDPSSANPLALTFNNLNLTTADIDITFNRKSSWVFVSEVSFGSNSANANAVPVPAATWLFGSGLLGLIGVSRRKSSV